MNLDAVSCQTLHLLPGPVTDKLETGLRHSVGDAGEYRIREPARRIHIRRVAKASDEDDGGRRHPDWVKRLRRELECQWDPDDRDPRRRPRDCTRIALSKDDHSAEERPRRTLVTSPQCELDPPRKPPCPRSPAPCSSHRLRRE